MSLWLALAVGAGMTFFLLKSRWNYLQLPELPSDPRPPERLDLAVVIPARNEESRIARVVQSLSRARVYVVDDASSDGTALRARQAGAAVIPAPPLPSAFAGKPHACWHGARATDSKWLLFADADTWYEPAFLRSLVSFAESRELDMASVFLRQECVGFAEKAILPYAFALYFCGVDGRAVNRVSSDEALANGQCMLFRRDAYNFIGGHAAVMGSVIEDVQLAQVAKRHRLRSLVMRAEKLGAVRMYEGFGAIARGFRKNSFRFLVANPWTGAQVVIASVLLASYLPVAALLAWEGRWLALAAFAALPSALLAPWYGGFVPALLAPLAIYPFQWIALQGMLSTTLGRPVEWKGRAV